MNQKLKKLCEKLKNGFQGFRGQPYEPNAHIDFARYAIFLEAKGFREATSINYLKWVHKFQAEVNSDNIKMWESHVFLKSGGEEAKKRLNYLVFLSLSLYLKAIERGDLLKVLIDSSDVSEVMSQPQFKGVTDSEWTLLLENILNNLLKDVTVLMRVSGLRVGEVENMRVSWVKEINGQYVLNIPSNKSKSRKKECAPLSKSAYSVVEPYLHGKKPQDLVFRVKFIAKNGKEKYRKLCNNDFVLCYRRLPDIQSGSKTQSKLSPHTLRHQFAHDLEKRGFLPSEIQLLMRHSDLSTTSRYLQKDQARVFEKFYGNSKNN